MPLTTFAALLISPSNRHAMQTEVPLTSATAQYGVPSSRTERLACATRAAVARLPRPSDEECARIAAMIRGAGSMLDVQARQPHRVQYDLVA